MVTLSFSFVCKMILEAVVACGFDRNKLGTMESDKHHEFSVGFDKQDLFMARVQTSLVDESPINLRITAQTITPLQMLSIAEKIKSLYGDRVNITLLATKHHAQ